MEGILSGIDFGQYEPNKKRTLNLWEKTCFEIFIANQSGQYFEFNFSPNFSWNIFYFEKLRGPLFEFPITKVPQIDILISQNKFVLVACIDKTIFPNII